MYRNRTKWALGGALFITVAANAFTGWHQVQAGDTLWDLAQYYLGQAIDWPEIWQLNPQVDDPDLIYPQQLLRLPGRAAPAAAGMSPGGIPKEGLPPVAAPDGSILAAAPSQHDAQMRVTAPSNELVNPDRSSQTSWVPLDSKAGESVSSNADAGLPYVDRLIDPARPEDDFSEWVEPSQGAAGRIEQSVEMVAQYRDDGVYYDGSVDRGVMYTARLRTANWGDFKLTAIALDENNGYNAGGSGSGPYQQQEGLRRFSLAQTGLPLTDTISMDNVIGIHRQSRYNPFRDRPNLINYRFGAAEPDIKGVSSHISFGRTGLAVSAGELGQTRGSLLPGFVDTEGKVQRVQLGRVWERHAVHIDTWQTAGQMQLEDRSGYRVALDHRLGERSVLSYSGIGSGSNHAFLIGGATNGDYAKHDYGAYYFDPDIIWMDARIGDDNTGAFYRYHSRQATYTWGASLEVRRDGLQGERSYDTGYLGINFSQRVNRRSSLSGAYALRHVRDRDGTASYEDHSLRGYYSLSHGDNARSNLGVRLRSRRDEEEVELSYGWNRQLDSDSTFELESRYRSTFANRGQGSELLLDTRFSRQLRNGAYISAGLGYSLGRSVLDENSGFNGYLGVEAPLTDKLVLSLQLDYSYDQVEYEEDDLAAGLFTDVDFDDDDFTSRRTWSALLRLRYQIGNAAASSVLARRGSGSGSVRGFVFVDQNGDGTRQATEPGVSGVTVFLNSVHPVITDARGEYRFPQVGLGAHFLFVDETALPLPWSLVAGEYTRFEVQLRRATRVDIPVSPLSLTEEELLPHPENPPVKERIARTGT